MSGPSIRDLVARVQFTTDRARNVTDAEWDQADADYMAAKLDLLTTLSMATGLTIPEVRNLGDVL